MQLQRAYAGLHVRQRVSPAVQHVTQDNQLAANDGFSLEFIGLIRDSTAPEPVAPVQCVPQHKLSELLSPK